MNTSIYFGFYEKGMGVHAHEADNYTVIKCNCIRSPFAGRPHA